MGLRIKWNKMTEKTPPTHERLLFLDRKLNSYIGTYYFDSEYGFVFSYDGDEGSVFYKNDVVEWLLIDDLL